jgi:two-component system alkaline phosphatase synthesis response regulator PhoP
MNLNISRNFKVLIIDEDRKNIIFLESHLSNHYKVVLSECGINAHEIAVKEHPDLILLSVEMTSVDGFSLCDSLRKSTHTMNIPVILLATNCNVDTCIKAFKVGADDLVNKSCCGVEIQARVESKFRRWLELRIRDEIIECGNLKLNAMTYEVFLNNTKIDFSVTEFNLLKFLIENKDRIISRNNILSEVWKGCSVTTRTIDTHVLKLRKKLTEFNYEFISTYGVGYGIKLKKIPSHHDRQTLNMDVV